jgi:hypothetical protein
MVATPGGAKCSRDYHTGRRTESSSDHQGKVLDAMMARSVKRFASAERNGQTLTERNRSGFDIGPTIAEIQPHT